MARPEITGSKTSFDQPREFALGVTLTEDIFVGVRVVDEITAASICGISHMTWLRLKSLGQTPPCVQLSPRRIGYRIRDLVRWQEERLRPSGSAA